MSSPQHATTVVVDPDGGDVWAYACRTCRRIGSPYYSAGMARLDADRHDCNNPRAHEDADPTGCDPRFAGLKAAAWAVLLDN
ncbi:hypothetical protein [Verrucosispora sp. NA02020]|uniref:hypothetical protein n=1 Tax=Verrucosispora sp. NA02020 TaxID=2742132 RepID=UPI0015911641|nr:hypothetical protein [Verrucosispora sp. NA02020]QKW15413.1 hypothetical protein HUT12_23375 [Verrucosispora sp. NA02020]